MGDWRWAYALVVLVSILTIPVGSYALVISPCAAAPTQCWTESPDAGDLSSPQLLVGGPWLGISGDIGGPDTVDVFGFHWGGGLLRFGQIDSPPVFMSLWDFEGTTMLAGPAAGTVSASLDADDYLLKITTTLVFDPPFTIESFDVTGFPAPLFAPLATGVPEPSSVVLLGCGLAALAGLAWRRKVTRKVAQEVRMGQLRSACLLLALVTILAAPTGAFAGFINPWNESPDAGGLTSPQLLVGGPYDGIQGTIGDSDTVDVFGFHWDGGPFSASNLSLTDLFLSLWNFAGTSKLAGEDPNSVSGVLAAGDYLLKVATSTGLDPPFSIGIFDLPGHTAFISAPFATPEPSSVALLGCGLAALAGLAWRRKQA